MIIKPTCALCSWIEIAARGEGMYTPIQSVRVFEQVAEQIEKRILAGELRKGDRLPTERELAEQFHVSRTAVREAMENSIGLLMKLKLGEVGGSDNLVQVREILEVEIAALAAARATDKEIAAMREAVKVMDESLNNADAFIAADNRFHEA